MTAADHLRVLAGIAPDLRVTVVLADPSMVDDDQEAFEAEVSRMGATVKYARLGRADAPGTHDVLRLATAYREIFEEYEEN